MKTSKGPQSGFAHIILVIIIALLIGGLAFMAIKGLNRSSRSGKNGTASWQAGCSGKDRVSMTHIPMNMDDVREIDPIGLTAGSHVTPIDHLYFYPKESPRDKYPVYAMADGTIVEIQARNVNVSSGEQRPPEYRIVIQHSCQTISYFDLVTKLDPSIAAKVGSLSSNGWSGRIAVKGGQEIGRIGGQSLDTAIYNMDLTLKGFIHPDMYAGEPWKIHTDDFFSYFDSSLKDAMLAKNPRTVEPRSGKIDYDLAGKLRGNWFKTGTGGYTGDDSKKVGDGSGRGYWSGHLAFFYNAFKPSQINISIGEFENGQPEAFAVSGNTPDPANVDTSSGVVKYELLQITQNGTLGNTVRGVILVQVEAGEKLKVEIFPGKTANQVSGFTSAAVNYER